MSAAKGFEQLYRDYAGDVFRFALYLCGNTGWAQDLTSETFVRALTRTDSLRMPTVKAYLLAIVRNLYLKEVRREQRHTQLIDYLPDKTPGPEASAEQQFELNITIRYLQNLPEVDRSALLMRALYEMPYQEIAAALGLSPAAARVKVHRARLVLVEWRNQKMKGDENV